MAVSNYAVAPYEQIKHLCLMQGEMLPSQANCLWKLDSGFVRSFTWNEEGDLVTLGLWGPGDAFGKALSAIKPYQMECLSAVQVQQLSASSQELCGAMRSHIQHMEELLSIIGYKRAPHRLLKFLDWLGGRFGRDVEQGRIIDLRLTHQLLAEITGITRVTATRLLNDFERQGKLIRLQKQQILLREGLGR